MSTKDLKIGTQLRMGLGAILLLVLALGALALQQNAGLWEQTRVLYEHPFQVRRALGALQVDVLVMHRGMKDAVMGDSEPEVVAALQDIDTHKADAFRQLEVLRARYLGPQEDVEAAHAEFVRWNTLREQTLRLAREGRKAEAQARTTRKGAGGAQLEVLLERLHTVDRFARNKGDNLYLASEEQYRTFRIRLGAGLGGVIILSLLVAAMLHRRIQMPLQALAQAMLEYRKGDQHARCAYASKNEFGTVADAYNALADSVQAETTFKERAAELNAVMLTELEAGGLRGRLLETVMRLTGSQVGAIYLLDDKKTAYEHFESIGLGGEARASFSAAELEGEVGAALVSGRIAHVKEISDDARFTFATASGDFRPRELLTIPLRSEQETPAMISLASLRAYGPVALRLVEDTQGALAAGMNSLLTNRRIRVLNDKLAAQNRELHEQKRELVAQAGELGEQNAELAQQKSQLDQANRLKTTFLSNMSHELRTPLNSVIALSGVLGRRLAGTIREEERGYLDVIERNGKHLLSLINDILDLARIESGKEELTIERFSVSQLAAELVAMLEPQARDKNIAISNTLGDDLPLLTSDRIRCRHILQNLLANAVKFTEAGRVKISAAATDRGLRISISDTGIGIAPDRLGMIFEEFRQADESTARKYGGTGLGLAIARKSAVLLQGTLEVESTPGKGSTFTLTLPLALEACDAAACGTARSLPAPVRDQGRGKRLLLVEDSEPIVIQMKDILASQGYEVAVARGGREALTALEGALPDAIILDLMMPEVDGFAVLKALRDAERTAHLPVLILTAKHVTKEELSFLRGNHIHQLVQKGDIGRSELLAAVGAMVVPPVEPIARQRPSSPRPTRTGKPVVLVVEDNPDNLLTARAVLQDHYEVIEAGDGKACLAQAIAHRPDLVLMDISLPVMDGIEALQAMRADDRLRGIPVIALTASAMKGNREEILAHGFDAYIAKPIDAKSFLQTIQGVLDGNA